MWKLEEYKYRLIRAFARAIQVNKKKDKARKRNDFRPKDWGTANTAWFKLSFSDCKLIMIIVEQMLNKISCVFLSYSTKNTQKHARTCFGTLDHSIIAASLEHIIRHLTPQHRNKQSENTRNLHPKPHPLEYHESEMAISRSCCLALQHAPTVGYAVEGFCNLY